MPRRTYSFSEQEHNTMRAQIAKRIAEHGSGIMEISKAAGINHSNISDYLAKRTTMRTDMIERICTALNCEILIVPRG